MDGYVCVPTCSQVVCVRRNKCRVRGVHSINALVTEDEECAIEFKIVFCRYVYGKYGVCMRHHIENTMLLCVEHL